MEYELCLGWMWSQQLQSNLSSASDSKWRPRKCFIDCIEAEDKEGQQVGEGGPVVGGVLGPGGRPAGWMNAY